MSKRKKGHSLTDNTMSKRKKVIVWQTIKCLKEKSHSLTDNAMSKRTKGIAWQTIQCLKEQKS